jgi:hypothetical protein
MYIDGDIWLADGGDLLRVVNGNSAGWSATAPGDAILRDAPTYTRIASGADRRTGTIYGYDSGNDRVVALSKVNGAYIAQYRLAAGATAWADLRGFYVEPGLEQEPDALVWISATGLHRVLLQRTGETASPAPSGAGPSGAGSSPGASPHASR